MNKTLFFNQMWEKKIPPSIQFLLTPEARILSPVFPLLQLLQPHSHTAQRIRLCQKWDDSQKRQHFPPQLPSGTFHCGDSEPNSGYVYSAATQNRSVESQCVLFALCLFVVFFSRCKNSTSLFTATTFCVWKRRNHLLPSLIKGEHYGISVAPL